MEKLFEISDLKCSYDRNRNPEESKVILEITDLVIPRGKKIFIVGESGIGKSTILEVLGLMNNTIVPNQNTRFLFYADGQTPIDIIGLWKRNNDKELSEFRLKHFNFIFQSTNLMRNFTAYENISLTRMLQGYTQYSSFRRATEVLADLGLPHIDENRMAHELSGGQQQRLAFARAILPDFTVLFGDEPTGNLDSDNAVKAMEILTNKLNQLSGSSAIIVSHDMHLATTFADIIIKIRKEVSKDHHVTDEIAYHGVIDQECIFSKEIDQDSWSNGTDSYSTEDFEVFLKKVV
jgi:ABC-type lipoprotein export system ATPase subunit